MGADAAAEEQFGPYVVYERLGVGGMATVHRALERGIEGFERIVALKRLLPHLAEDASFIKSFVREAKLASILNHVNIVQIFELGRVGTEYFISMEYIDGRDVRRILRHARKVTGPPPIHVTVGLMLQVCDALDYAHSKLDDAGHPLGLVHRDVSPSNLLVTSAGHLKVIDFGIAKAQSSQLRTQPGRVKGKLAYMAPEAIAGKDLDARSDLFAAGVIAHELLTARPLFASKNEYQTLLKVQRGDIMPPSTFNQGCPPELDAIVLKALARDPDERFLHAAELREELLAMRKQYNLQTSYRDIATWLDWAFSLEIPTGGFGAVATVDQTGTGNSFDARSSQRNRTPRPRKEDDDAVELAWGGGDPGEGKPVVLDDIPDVSEKHLAGAAALGAEPQIEPGYDLADDIPTPQPSHGHRPVTATDRTHITPLPSRETQPKIPVRDTQPTRIPTIAASQRDQEPMVTPNQGVGVGPAFRPGTIPSGLGPPPRERRATTQGTSRAPTDQDPLLSQIASSTDVEHAALPQGVRSQIEQSAPLPVVRFREPSAPPPDTASIPRTRPGHEPARAAQTAEVPRESLDADAIPERPFSRQSTVSIGSAIVARQRVRPSRTALLVVLLGVAGIAATAVTLYFTRGSDTVPKVKDQPPPPPGKTGGTVRFMMQPEDATVWIGGKQLHTGSPWSIELPPGIHQIEIRRDGYKAWLTSIELVAAETQTLRVVLEPLGATPAMADAQLVLTSTPANLELVIDGVPSGLRTPIKVPLKPGTHKIALRKDGVDVWHKEIETQASANYEYNPTIGEKAHASAPMIETEPRTVRPSEPPAEPEKPDAQAAPLPAPAPAEPPVVVAPPPAQVTPPPAPPQPAVHHGPVTIKPGAVAKLSGEPPSIARFKNTDLPPIIAAKLCIDESGHVTSADILSKQVERHAASDLVSALHTWVYAPYKDAGVPQAACFVATFKVK